MHIHPKADRLLLAVTPFVSTFPGSPRIAMGPSSAVRARCRLMISMVIPRQRFIPCRERGIGRSAFTPMSLPGADIHRHQGLPFRRSLPRLACSLSRLNYDWWKRSL